MWSLQSSNKPFHYFRGQTVTRTRFVPTRGHQLSGIRGAPSPCCPPPWPPPSRVSQAARPQWVEGRTRPGTARMEGKSSCHPLVHSQWGPGPCRTSLLTPQACHPHDAESHLQSIRPTRFAQPLTHALPPRPSLPSVPSVLSPTCTRSCPLPYLPPPHSTCWASAFPRPARHTSRQTWQDRGVPRAGHHPTLRGPECCLQSCSVSLLPSFFPSARQRVLSWPLSPHGWLWGSVCAPYFLCRSRRSEGVYSQPGLAGLPVHLLPPSHAYSELSVPPAIRTSLPCVSNSPPLYRVIPTSPQHAIISPIWKTNFKILPRPHFPPLVLKTVSLFPFMAKLLEGVFYTCWLQSLSSPLLKSFQPGHPSATSLKPLRSRVDLEDHC